MMTLQCKTFYVLHIISTTRLECSRQSRPLQHINSVLVVGCQLLAFNVPKLLLHYYCLTCLLRLPCPLLHAMISAALLLSSNLLARS
jgi:hypothetical protein